MHDKHCHVQFKVSTTVNLCTKQGNYSIFEQKIRGLYNQEPVIMVPIGYLDFISKLAGCPKVKLN